MSSRKFTKDDFLTFVRAMEADPQHAELSPTDFLFEPMTETHVWEDEQGPVYYFRLSREIRVDIQFRNDISVERTREGLKSGVAWLAKELEPSGFRALVFDSVYRPLIAFAKRRLGFKESPDLRKFLAGSTSDVRSNSSTERVTSTAGSVLLDADQRVQHGVRREPEHPQ